MEDLACVARVTLRLNKDLEESRATVARLEAELAGLTTVRAARLDKIHKEAGEASKSLELAQSKRAQLEESIQLAITNFKTRVQEMIAQKITQSNAECATTQAELERTNKEIETLAKSLREKLHAKAEAESEISVLQRCAELQKLLFKDGAPVPANAPETMEKLKKLIETKKKNSQSIISDVSIASATAESHKKAFARVDADLKATQHATVRIKKLQRDIATNSLSHDELATQVASLQYAELRDLAVAHNKKYESFKTQIQKYTERAQKKTAKIQQTQARAKEETSRALTTSRFDHDLQLARETLQDTEMMYARVLGPLPTRTSASSSDAAVSSPSKKRAREPEDQDPEWRPPKRVRRRVLGD
jgi:hypothetical protein